MGILPANGHSYHLSGTDLIFEVPERLLLLIDIRPGTVDGEGDTVTFEDVLSRASVVLDLRTGDVISRNEYSAWPFSSIDIEELFDRLIASIRHVPLGVADP